MKADLHVHSTASDGTLTPPELVSLAAALKVDVLAIADHDSVEGIPDALVAAQQMGITLVPAVELSATSGLYDIHVLGYFVNHEDEALHEHLADLREARERRARAMVHGLAESGFSVTFEQVMEFSDGGAIGRSHVARALVAAGHADSVREAFEQLIGRGRPHYVAKDARTPQEVISMIHSAGGVAILAHPGVNALDDLIPALVEAGLDGIEAYHADHSPEQRVHYARLAAALGLLASGGTDFHGHGAPNPEPGSVAIPDEAVRALLARGGC